MKLFKLNIILWEDGQVKSCIVLAESKEAARELVFKSYERERIMNQKMMISQTNTLRYNQKWLDEKESKCHEIDINSYGIIHDRIGWDEL